MFEDKRSFDRIPLGSRCIVYYDNQEQTGKVIDISEGGIGLMMNGDFCADNLAVTFFDDNPYFMKCNGKCVFSCRGKVVRNCDNVYGCTICLTDEIRNYIATKKAIQFMAYR